MRSDKPWIPSIPEAQLLPCPQLPSTIVLSQLPGLPVPYNRISLPTHKGTRPCMLQLVIRSEHLTLKWMCSRSFPEHRAEVPLQVIPSYLPACPRMPGRLWRDTWTVCCPPGSQWWVSRAAGSHGFLELGEGRVKVAGVTS